MMNDNDKSWLKYILAAFIIGLVIGEFLSKVLALVFIAEKWGLLVKGVVPLTILLALAIVLYAYNREKDDIL